MDADPARAREAIGAVEATGRQALGEMRRLLGVLRSEDEHGEDLSPRPSLQRMGELIEQVRDAGLRVDQGRGTAERHLPGHRPLRLPDRAGGAHNVLKHAGPASARVLLRYRRKHLLIAVLDDGRGLAMGRPPTGHGMVGMRERAALFGGELRAGPRPGGGYAVVARLPLESSR